MKWFEQNTNFAKKRSQRSRVATYGESRVRVRVRIAQNIYRSSAGRGPRADPVCSLHLTRFTITKKKTFPGKASVQTCVFRFIRRPFKREKQDVTDATEDRKLIRAVHRQKVGVMERIACLTSSSSITY